MPGDRWVIAGLAVFAVVFGLWIASVIRRDERRTAWCHEHGGSVIRDRGSYQACLRNDLFIPERR